MRIAFPSRNGATATAVCSVTTSPPTILVYINCRPSAEPLIEASGALATIS
ncbi:flavin reductase [Microvirga tunisiensis]|uniref:flavin reductase n=1 Tax=Microvirga tunisiensis TaxID=2108360 RepID=UPI00129C441A|nr:flavin reductase [Microvirga tunisiensis]